MRHRRPYDPLEVVVIDLEVETATLVAIHQASREFHQRADCQTHVNKIREKRTKSSFPRKRESSVLGRNRAHGLQLGYAM
jgi:hypothetical protein